MGAKMACYLLFGKRSFEFPVSSKCKTAFLEFFKDLLGPKPCILGCGYASSKMIIHIFLEVKNLIPEWYLGLKPNMTN
jgi:hypothetical protein